MVSYFLWFLLWLRLPSSGFGTNIITSPSMLTVFLPFPIAFKNPYDYLLFNAWKDLPTMFEFTFAWPDQAPNHYTFTTKTLMNGSVARAIMLNKPWSRRCSSSINSPYSHQPSTHQTLAFSSFQSTHLSSSKSLLVFTRSWDGIPELRRGSWAQLWVHSAARRAQLPPKRSGSCSWSKRGRRSLHPGRSSCNTPNGHNPLETKPGPLA